MVVRIGGIDYIYDEESIKKSQAKNVPGEFKERTRVSKVTFDEAAHTYTADVSGKKYISATTLIGKFKQKFDAVAVSTAYAKKNGNTPEYWQQQWAKISKTACDKGTLFHKRKEDEGIAAGGATRNKKWIPVHVAEALAQIEHDYHNIPDGIHQELQLWNHYFEIAGLTDLCIVDGNYFDIDDYKTNKKIDKTSFRHPKTGYKKMLFPLTHLQDCNFNHYQLQLSLYAFMFEQLSGKTCRSICFHHHPPRADDALQAQEEGIRYDCKYLRNDILKMLHTGTGKSIAEFIKKGSTGIQYDPLGII